MSNPEPSHDPDAPRPEYDFSGGQRGKYAAGYGEGSHIVPIAADLLALFPDAKAVDAALRELIARREREG